MNMNEILSDWKQKLSASQDKRDFCNDHKFRLEAMSFDKEARALWSAICDIETWAHDHVSITKSRFADLEKSEEIVSKIEQMYEDAKSDEEILEYIQWATP